MTERFYTKKIWISTAHAAISLIENIEKAIDNKMLVCGVFVDLQKAFDTADHNILHHKLSHYGIRDIASQLLVFSHYGIRDIASQLLVFFLPL